MKKTFLLLLLSIVWCTGAALAQNTQKADDKKPEAKNTDTKDADKAENTNDRHAKEKAFWKKVGNDQKDFWKGEHERHVKGEGPGKPPPPPNPFKKKKKQDTEKETGNGDKYSK